jgi:hypothetical protein
MKTVDGNPKRPSLEERFNAFLSQLDNAENIDSALSDAELGGGERADFLLAGCRIVLELKTIATDPEYKVEERLAPYRERPEFPVFYWQTDLNDVLTYLPDGEEIRLKVTHAVTRSVQGALEKADDQIEVTKKTLNIEQACGVVAILNVTGSGDGVRLLFFDFGCVHFSKHSFASSQAPAWEHSRRSSSFKTNSPRPHHFDQTFLAGMVPRWNRANARAFSGVVCDPGCRRSGIPSRRLCRQRIADLQPYLCLHSGCVPSSQFTPLCCGEKRSRPDPHSRA